MTFLTPANAEKVSALSTNQKTIVRQSFGIQDDPMQPERTYIVFDADAGNNDLHLIIGASSTYSILKGDGTLALLYTDTGGTKTLSYDVAGRYLITIDGNFNGIDTSGETQPEKDKYISIIGGTNYLPTTITLAAFHGCSNLEVFEVPHITAIGDNGFLECVSLSEMYLPNIVNIGSDAFNGSGLKKLSLSNDGGLISIGTNAFTGVYLTYLRVIKIISPSIEINDLNTKLFASGCYFSLNIDYLYNGLQARSYNIDQLDVLLINADSVIAPGIIQYKFQNLSTGDVNNSSNTVPALTGLEVAITPKSVSSKLIVSFHSDWEYVANQQGCQIEYEYSDDNYVTSTIVLASIIVQDVGVLRRTEVSGKLEIPNPGLIEIKCRVIFTVQTDGEQATFKGTRGAFMDISEIIL